MINYKNGKTQFQLTEKEVNEHTCMLIIFCKMNAGSKQVAKIKKHLTRLEKALANGNFKN